MSVSEEVKAPNPLEEGLRRRRSPEPCALTIFGASGDLTQRKLFPALYALAFRDQLPPKFGVVGVARTEMSDQEFREKMKQAIQDHARDEFRQDVWDEFACFIFSRNSSSVIAVRATPTTPNFGGRRSRIARA